MPNVTQFDLVGILNITPDSFSDAGLYFDTAKATRHAREMFASGATIVDIGAESTRPGAEEISESEEWRRLRPVLSVLLPEFSGRISVDTSHVGIIKKIVSMNLGEFMINDVTTFNDPAMIKAAADIGCVCIVSHLPFWAYGNIQAVHAAEGRLMQNTGEVKIELVERMEEMILAGIAPEKIIVDPGIGFGKTPELNLELVHFAEEIPGIPVLIGYSQKRFLGEKRFDKRVNLQQGMIAKQSGARYIRVHNISDHRSLMERA